MRHPTRLFCMHLAEKMGMSVKRLLAEFDSHELSEWMAFYMTKDEKWQTKYKKEVELQHSRDSGDEARSDALKRLFLRK